MTGREVIHKMLGTDCRIIISNDTKPTYMPFNRTIYMPWRFLNGSANVDVAVAAHEAAHAIQHASGSWLMYAHMALSVLFFLNSRLAVLVGIACYLIQHDTRSFIIMWVIISIYMVYRFVNYYIEKDANEIAYNWLSDQDCFYDIDLSIIADVYNRSLKSYEPL